MADAVRIGGLTSETTRNGHGRPPAHGPRSTEFHTLLAGALKGQLARAGGTHPSRHPGILAAVAKVPNPSAPTQLADKAPVPIPVASDAALAQAMTLEGVPASWKDSLDFIMARESGGKVDAQSPVHSARGLFQLTAANHHYNPNGAASFGNAVQEAQGGIRYIRQRYGTADNAVSFWRTHHWY